MWNSRFRGILPERSVSVMVVGAGAVGSHVVYVLRKMGQEVELFDPDVFLPENLGTQLPGLWAATGQPKVEAVAMAVEFLAAGIPGCINTRYEKADGEIIRQSVASNILVTCTDSMSSRKEILEAFVERDEGFAIDVRVGSRVVQVNCANLENKGEVDSLMRNIVPDEEAVNEPCGQSMFPPTALVAAGIVGNTLAAYLMRERYQKSVTLDLKNWIVA
jgi:tRNA A37 threonylcarbamoyladenosine dehydratase